MPLEFTVVADNEKFIVINKAANVDFHTIDQKLGIVELVKQELGLALLFPVHRLDSMTSGLLIFAKTKEVAAQFGVLFETRSIEKFYLALSDKKPKRKQGLIKGDMKKGRNGSYLLLKSSINPAVTQFFSYSIAPSLRGYLLKPHTGKTHQLRVAMKSLGAPILGDNRYYPNTSLEIGHLHAWQLSFNLDNQHYRFMVNPNWPNDSVSQWLNTLDEIDELQWPTI